MNMSKFKVIYYDCEPTIYGINKKGVVVNLKSGHIMKQRLSVNGYYIVRLSIDKYHRKEFFVHRLLALCFIDNPENKPFIHHIDKNKLNNKLKNLIWVTEEEHMEFHLNDDGHVFAKGEKHSRAILSDDDVHKICLYIENNMYTQKELAKMFNVDTPVIRDIRCGYNWRHISELYDFSNYTKLEWSASDEETIRHICEDIVSNLYNAKEISKRNNINVEVVLRILKGKSFKNIICDYDLKSNTIIRTSNKLENDKIVSLIKNGKTNNEIIDILKLERCAKINSRLCRLHKKI